MYYLQLTPAHKSETTDGGPRVTIFLIPSAVADRHFLWLGQACSSKPISMLMLPSACLLMLQLVRDTYKDESDNSIAEFW